MANRYLTQTLSSSGMDSDIQVGTINLVIRLTIYERGIPVDLSSASVKQIWIKKPDNTIVTKTANFLTDGTDGIVQYVTIAGDLNLAGAYSVQAYFEMVDFIGFSTISTFQVNANL